MTTAEAEAYVVAIGSEIYDQLVTDGVNLITNLDVSKPLYLGESPETESTTRQASRAVINSLIGTQLKARMDFALTEWGLSDSIKNPFPFNTTVWWRWMRDYHQDTGPFTGGAVDRKVDNRPITRGAEPAMTGHNIFRLNEDFDGQLIETGNPQKMTLESLTGPGVAAQEVKLSADPSGKDIYDIKGTGQVIVLPSWDETTSSLPQVLSNPNMNHTIADGVAVASANVASWTLSSNWLSDKTNLFRTRTESIKTTTDLETITQSVVSEMELGQPFLPVQWVYPDSINAADGFLVDWGDQSQAFTGLVNATWQPLVPTRDKKIFPIVYDNATTGAQFKITVDNDNATGTFTVGPALWIPLVRFNGAWIAAITDEISPLLGATANFTDSVSPSGKLNHIWALLYGTAQFDAYLPTTGSNSIPNPT